MAVQIASLFAKISADTRELNKGLIAAEAALAQTAGKMRDVGDKAAPQMAKGFGQATQDIAKMFVVPMATIAAFGVATKKAFDFSEQGAAVIQTATSFDRLGVSIEAMRGTSRGTVDDMTLMSGTLMLVAGASEELQAKMLESAPQLMAIAKAANAVNPALGDTAFMYDSISRGIKRSSPLILDNLGIIVKVGEANEAYAEAIGKTVAQLTAEDKQIALLNATLASGNRLIEQAGGSTAAYGDAWAAVRVEIKNSTDAMKAQAAEGLGPLIGRYAELLRTTRENEQEMIGFGAAARFVTAMLGGNEEVTRRMGFVMNVLTGDYYNAFNALERYSDGMEETSKTTEHTTNSQKALNKEIELGMSLREQMWLEASKSNTLTSSLAKHQEDLAWKLNNSAAAWDMYNDAMQQSTTSSGMSVKAIEKLNDTFSSYERRRSALSLAIAGPIRQENERYNESLEDMQAQMAEVGAEIEKLEGSHGRLVTIKAKDVLTENELGLLIAKRAADTARLNAQLEKAPEDQNLKTIAQMRVNIDKYNEKLGQASGNTTALINNTKKIGELKGEYDELAEGVANLNAEHDRALKFTMFDLISQRMDAYNKAQGIDATTPEGQQALLDQQAVLDGIAVKWGLIDEATLRAAQSADGWIGRLVGSQDDVDESIDRFLTLGEEGAAAMGDIESKTGSSVARMIDLGIEAQNTQREIDKMHGKDLIFNLLIKQRTETAGRAAEEGFNIGAGAIPDIKSAQGFQGMVSSPTRFTVAEGGEPEFVSVIPKSDMQAGGYGMGATWNGNLVIQGAGSPEATADLVLRKLADRGMISQGGPR